MDLPPREFLDRVQSPLLGLTLPPPHHVAPSSACVPAALSSTEYVFVHKDASIQPLSRFYRGPYRVLSHQDKIFSLGIGSRQDTVSIDELKPVLGPVLGPQQPPWLGRAPSSALISPPLVQDPGLNPFGEFLSRSAPSLRRSSRLPRAVLGPCLLFSDWFLLHVLFWKLFLLLYAGTLDVWLEEFCLHLPLYHQLLVDLGDDAGGEPSGSSECRLPHQLFCLQTDRLNRTAFHIYSIY